MKRAGAISPTTHSAQSGPFVILIFGAPGSGKTTLSKALAESLRLPCLHRDDFWIGLLGTHLHPSAEVRPAPTGVATTTAFVDALVCMLAAGVSCIGDDNLSVRAPEFLERLRQAGHVLLIRTHADDAPARFAHRIRTDSVAAQRAILQAMGADTVEDVVAANFPSARELVAIARDYEPGPPVLDVDTTSSIEAAVDRILRQLPIWLATGELHTGQTHAKP